MALVNLVCEESDLSYSIDGAPQCSSAWMIQPEPTLSSYSMADYNLITVQAVAVLALAWSFKQLYQFILDKRG